MRKKTDKNMFLLQELSDPTGLLTNNIMPPP
jgi:hypothetical protein